MFSQVNSMIFHCQNELSHAFRCQYSYQHNLLCFSSSDVTASESTIAFFVKPIKLLWPSSIFVVRSQSYYFQQIQGTLKGWSQNYGHSTHCLQQPLMLVGKVKTRVGTNKERKTSYYSCQRIMYLLIGLLPKICKCWGMLPQSTGKWKLLTG